MSKLLANERAPFLAVRNHCAAVVLLLLLLVYAKPEPRRGGVRIPAALLQSWRDVSPLSETNWDILDLDVILVFHRVSRRSLDPANSDPIL